MQHRQGTTLQGCDLAKTDKGAKAGDAPYKPKTQQTETLQPLPASRGRYKPGARRREGANCGARPIQALGGNGHRMRGGPWQRQHSGRLCAAEGLAVAPAGLDGRTVERPSSQASGTPMSHSISAEMRMKSRFMSPWQSCRMWRATRATMGGCAPSGGRAAARGILQVREGGEATRVQSSCRVDRPGAVVTSKDHRRCYRQRQAPNNWPNDRTSHAITGPLTGAQ